MKDKAWNLVLILVAAAVAALAATCGSGGAGPDPEAVLLVYDRMAARVAWPGFSAGAVPLAFTDGHRAWMLRHPSPPEPFRRLRGTEGAYVAEAVPLWLGGLPAPGTGESGRVVEVAGVPTAAVALAAEGEAPADAGPQREQATSWAARALLHVAFHAGQDARHPERVPDEALRLAAGPAGAADARVLSLGRLETLALRRALHAPDTLHRACWIAEALEARAARHADVDPERRRYERAVEVREGVARSVVGRAVHPARLPSLPADGWAPGAIRERAAGVGEAWAALLEGRGSGWRDSVEATGALRPERWLPRASAVARSRCRLPRDEVSRARAVARSDLEREEARRASRLRGFRATPGWTLLVEAPPRSPLLARPVEPRESEPLGDGLLLHGESGLRLEHERGVLVLAGRRALTEPGAGVGTFPSTGRALVVGLLPGPEVRVRGDTVHVSAAGVHGRFTGGEVRRERADRTIRVVLGDGAR